MTGSAYPLAVFFMSALVAPCAGTVVNTRLNLRVQHQKQTPAKVLEVAKTDLHMPSSLVDLGDQCNCHFRDTCSCGATLEFMQCIADACNSGKCKCSGGAHFQYACGNMSSTCPDVPMKCTADQAMCASHPPVSATGTPPVVDAMKKVLESPPKAPTIDPQDDTAVDAAGKAVKAAKEAQEKAKPAAKSWKEWADRQPGVMRLLWAAPGVFSVIPFVLVAYIYSRYRLTTDFRQRLSFLTADGFSYNLFECFEDRKIMCLAFCCGPLRWADTMDKANPTLMRYWTAIAVFIVLIFLSPFLGFITSLGALALCTVYRQKLRAQLGIKSGTAWTILEDFCTYTWCSCCAIAQEARQVESIKD